MTLSQLFFPTSYCCWNDKMGGGGVEEPLCSLEEGRYKNTVGGTVIQLDFYHSCKHQKKNHSGRWLGRLHGWPHHPLPIYLHGVPGTFKRDWWAATEKGEAGGSMPLKQVLSVSRNYNLEAIHNEDSIEFSHREVWFKLYFSNVCVILKIVT